MIALRQNEGNTKACDDDRRNALPRMGRFFKAFELIFPTYFFSRVSGLLNSGNLNPTNLGFSSNFSCNDGGNFPRIF